MRKKQDEEIQSSDIVYNKEGRARKRTDGFLGKLRKWWMLPLYLILVVVVILFIKSGDEDDPYKARYGESVDEVIVGEVSYRIISSTEDEEYIGSYVSSRLNAVSGDKIASLRSYLLYVSVFFSVEGDDNLDYVIDGKKNLYIREDKYETIVNYYNNEDNITEYKMTSKKKDLETMNPIRMEEIEMLRELDGEEKIFDEILLTEDFETRREIYGFYDNGICYKAEMELFKYKDVIYKTTWFVDGNDNEGTTVIKGVALPEEYQERFKEIWD